MSARSRKASFGSFLLSSLLVGFLLMGGQASMAQSWPEGAAEAIETWVNLEKRPDAADTMSLINAGVRLVDVRSQAEWDQGHAKLAAHLPVGDVAEKAARVLPDKEQPVVVYCAVGARAWWAARTLGKLGYSRVVAMSGGFNDLEAAGFELETGSGRSAHGD